MAALKGFPVHRFCAVMFTFSSLLGLTGSNFILEQSCAQPWARRREGFNPGLGDVRDVALSLINRLNQTESAVFKLWMLYFQRISF